MTFWVSLMGAVQKVVAVGVEVGVGAGSGSGRRWHQMGFQIP